MDALAPNPPTTLRIVCRGNLVASTVEDQRKMAMESMERPCSELVLDLSAASVVDSLGITLILGMFKTCQQRGIAFGVVGASADLLRVFKLFNLPKLFPIREA